MNSGEVRLCRSRRRHSATCGVLAIPHLASGQSFDPHRRTDATLKRRHVRGIARAADRSTEKVTPVSDHTLRRDVQRKEGIPKATVAVLRENRPETGEKNHAAIRHVLGRPTTASSPDAYSYNSACRAPPGRTVCRFTV